ncbi:MAG TPA: GNAT family N-acetyltransferase [Armatimonadota bacterium]|nr:GNAT family N-acetyltransferase [Armatimonadota bacterium]
MQDAVEIRPAQGHGEFRQALAVRVAVFVREQGGPPEDEPDAWDSAARHYVVAHGGRVIGAARLYEPSRRLAKIGRVALLPEYRGRGWGARLMKYLLGQARALGYGEVVLDSQTWACPFYRRFGFAPEGEEWIEGGLPHRRMRLFLGPES